MSERHYFKSRHGHDCLKQIRASSSGLSWKFETVLSAQAIASLSLWISPAIALEAPL